MSTARTGAIGYKKLLLECRELAKNGRKGAFAMAKNLVLVFSDDAFRQDIGAEDDFAVAESLDEYVADLCLSFLEIKTLLEEFPSEEQWTASKSISHLYDEACERIAARKPEVKKPALTRNRITREEHDRVVGELKDREARLQFVEKQTTQAISTIEQLNAEIRRLQDENSDLRMENERLKGRIEELERIIHRELQTA